MAGSRAHHQGCSGPTPRCWSKRACRGAGLGARASVRGTFTTGSRKGSSRGPARPPSMPGGPARPGAVVTGPQALPAGRPGQPFATVRDPPASATRFRHRPARATGRDHERRRDRSARRTPMVAGKPLASSRFLALISSSTTRRPRPGGVARRRGAGAERGPVAGGGRRSGVPSTSWRWPIGEPSRRARARRVSAWRSRATGVPFREPSALLPCAGLTLASNCGCRRTSEPCAPTSSIRRARTPVFWTRCASARSLLERLSSFSGGSWIGCRSTRCSRRSSRAPASCSATRWALLRLADPDDPATPPLVAAIGADESCSPGVAASRADAGLAAARCASGARGRRRGQRRRRPRTSR